MGERTLIAAATNLLWRGFQVVPVDRKSPTGLVVNGLYAVARALERAIAFKAPARAVAVVDVNAPRDGWPDVLAAQLPLLPKLCEAFGFQVVQVDDELGVCASYARAALALGDDVVIAAVDKRFAQLVGEQVWWFDANKDVRYTEDIVMKRFNVPPAQVADWLALVGDDDQLPGVKGIGAKGATELLAAHGSVQAALAKLDALDGRVAKALRAAQADVPALLAQAHLAADAPLPRPLDALAFTPPDAAALNALHSSLGFSELLVADEGARHVEVLPDEAQLAQALARTRGAVLAVYGVLEEPAPVAEALVGVGLSAGQGQSFYVPVDGGAWPALSRWLEDDGAPKQGHELIGLTVALRRSGVTLRGVVRDSGCLSHLTQPSNWAPHDLQGVARHVLNRALPDDDAVLGVGRARKRWSQLPVDAAGAVAAQRADASADIAAALVPGVDAALLEEYLALSRTLVRMELHGLCVDTGQLEASEAAFAAIETELEVDITRLAGHAFNVNSSKQLGEVLFAELKLPVVSHTLTGWSTANEALERIEHAHPIVPLVLRWRTLRRLRDNWLVSLRRCIDADGRVHSRFHPARSLSGRLVNTNPDLGRVPGRTPRDGARAPRLRRPARLAVDVRRLRAAGPLRAGAPDEGPGAGAAPARGPRPAPPHRRRRAGSAARGGDGGAAPAGEGGELRHLRGPGRERAGDAAGPAAGGGEGVRGALRPPLRAGARLPGRAAAPGEGTRVPRHPGRAEVAHRRPRVARLAVAQLRRAPGAAGHARGLGGRRGAPRAAGRGSRAGGGWPEGDAGGADPRRGALRGAAGRAAPRRRGGGERHAQRFCARGAAEGGRRGRAHVG